MKRLIAILLTVQLILVISHNLFSQAGSGMQEFGITTGGLTNFPANQNYLKKNISLFYVSPYLRTGNHEFSAGIVYPLTTHGLYFNDDNINPRIGVTAGYKFYVLNVLGRENLFVHYSFQYLRFTGKYDKYYSPGNLLYHWTETDNYINNVIGLGYNLFLDTDEKFGFYYTLDYVISQTGYKLVPAGFNDNTRATQYIWNNLSTHLGFSFKLSSLKKKDKK